MKSYEHATSSYVAEKLENTNLLNEQTLKNNIA